MPIERSSRWTAGRRSASSVRKVAGDIQVHREHVELGRDLRCIATDNGDSNRYDGRRAIKPGSEAGEPAPYHRHTGRQENPHASSYSRQTQRRYRTEEVSSDQSLDGVSDATNWAMEIQRGGWLLVSITRRPMMRAGAKASICGSPRCQMASHCVDTTAKSSSEL
jgi:hypothetical protein